MRISASGLLRKYPLFTAWTFATAIKSASLLYVGIRFGYGSREYVAAWQPLQWLGVAFLLGVGWEAYQLTAQNYPSPGSHGRRTLCLAVLIAFAISIIPFGIDGQLWDNMTWVVTVLIRTATLTVGTALVIAVRRLRFVPISEHKNLKCHRRLIVLYCAGQAIGLGMLVLTKNLGWVSFHLAVTAVCWVMWFCLISPAGQQLQRRTYTDADQINMRRRWREVKRWLERAAASQRARPSGAPPLDLEST